MDLQSWDGCMQHIKLAIVDRFFEIIYNICAINKLIITFLILSDKLCYKRDHVAY